MPGVTTRAPAPRHESYRHRFRGAVVNPAVAIPTRQQVLRLTARPTGVPGPECWSATTEPVTAPGPGQVLVKVNYLSIDPGMRNWISEGGSYVEPVPLGAVMPGFGVGRVIASDTASVPAGAMVTGQLGVQQFATLAPDQLTVLNDISAPLPRYLGALGISGFTAYFGIQDIARPAPGSTVLVSGAAGSVGSIAGQIARLQGCRVIGIAGGSEKCRWITEELRFDVAIDYKSRELEDALDEVAPSGIDVFFDNVGGSQLDAVLARLRVNARVVLCGTVSQYNAPEWAGLRNHRSLLVKRARMEGFLVFDYAERYPEAQQQLSQWLSSGQLVAAEDVVGGGVVEFPAALIGLFDGANLGKRVLQVAETQIGPTPSADGA